MRARVLLAYPVLWILIAWPVSLKSAPPEKTNAERIRELIVQLGSSNFKEREIATQTLNDVGPAALDALQRATQSADPEIRRRAEHLTQQIQHRLQTAQLLEPKRVHLVYKDTPLSEAFADLMQKTGFPIEFAGSQTRLAGRRITLDTGNTTFWNAFDQFCQKAELVERTAVQSSEQTTTVKVWNVQGAQLAVPLKTTPRVSTHTDGRLILVDGKPHIGPTDYVGAVRVRALPAESVAPAGETLFLLDIAPQPKMAWQGIVDVRIDSALDDLGQNLKPVPAGLDSDPNTIVLAGNGVVRWDSRTGMISSGAARELPIRLKLPDKPSKILKEVKGAVAAEVQTPAHPLITVENILGAVGQSFKGPNAETVKVLEASRQTDGSVKLRLHMQNPTQDTFAGVNMRLVVNGNARILRQALVQNGQVTDSPDGLTSLTLLDSKGKEFDLVGRGENLIANGNGIIQDIQLTYRPRDEHAEPAKLVYSGRRNVIIEIPFKLKDVRLP